MNASFLDYRMPTSLDLPMIETIIVEVPNPGHPYGVREWARCLSYRPRQPSPTPSLGQSGCAWAIFRCLPKQW